MGKEMEVEVLMWRDWTFSKPPCGRTTASWGMREKRFARSWAGVWRDVVPNLIELVS